MSIAVEPMPPPQPSDPASHDGCSVGGRPTRSARLKRRGPDGLFDTSASESEPKRRRRAEKDAGPRRKTKPAYATIVRRALRDHAKENHHPRGGMSIAKLHARIEATYPVPEIYRRYVKRALQEAQADGAVERLGASYKLTGRGKRQVSRRKASRRKAAAVSDVPNPSSSPVPNPSCAPVPKPSCTPGGFRFLWQYEEEGAWKDYEINASDCVETAYRNYLADPSQCDVRSVASGKWQYQVDFLNMKQTNIQHENHTARAIRRCPL